MRTLLDINVLLALMTSEHLHHDAAQTWWISNGTNGWASCPLTQNGFVRISSQSSFSAQVTPRQAMDHLQDQIASSDHEFWPDSISITDAKLFDHSRILGPKQITDIYLLGLAVANGGRFVTFDRGISLPAVRGASRDHCVML